MINQELLRVVMRVEIALLVLSLVLFLGHGVSLFFREQRRVRSLAAGRPLLVRLLSDGGTDRDAAIATLRAIDFRDRSDLVLEISRNLSGVNLIAIREIADAIGVTARAREMCRSTRWSRRLRGARILSQLDEQDPIIETLIADRNASVRAQAAEWAATHPSPAIIARMLELLADREARSRFAVQDSLLRMGRRVTAPLAAFLSAPSGAATEAALELAEALPDPVFLPAALESTRHPSPRIRCAASALLGAVGGPEAANRLVELLDDGDQRVRAAAARALGRLRHWPAATRLAGMLADPSWDARLDAGLALRAIGGPGILLLRRASGSGAAGSGAAGAADMAHMVLDLPAGAR